MANSPTTTVDIKDILEAGSIGTFGATSGWSIRISREDGEPDQMITIYDTGGFESDPKNNIDQPTVQIRIRGNPQDYVNTRAKAMAIRALLHGPARQTVNGTVYVGIWLTGDIVFLRYDDNNRPIFTLNFRIVSEAA